MKVDDLQIAIWDFFLRRQLHSITCVLFLRNNLVIVHKLERYQYEYLDIARRLQKIAHLLHWRYVSLAHVYHIEFTYYFRDRTAL